MSLSLAFKAFFAALSGGEKASSIERALQASPAAEPTPRLEEKKTPPPERNDAVALLATLQREARFVDLIQEPLAQFSDAQIGAAARPCLQDCGKVLNRIFALEPLIASDEGQEVTVDQPRPTRCRVVSGGSDAATARGRLVHHGWVAGKAELPQWTGPREDVLVVAPAEIDAG